MRRLLFIVGLGLLCIGQGFGPKIVKGPIPGAAGVNIVMPTTNLLLWYRADKGVYADNPPTTPSTDGGTAAWWTNYIAANQYNANVDYDINSFPWPKYHSTVVNGLPALEFGGSSDHSSLIAGNVGGLGHVITPPWTVICVASCTNANGGVLWGDTTYGVWSLQMANPNAYWWYDAGHYFYFQATPLNRFQIVTSMENYSGATAVVRTNGVLANSGTMYATNLNGFVMGDIRSAVGMEFYGWIAEVLVYEPTLSSNDTFQAERYLSHKYWITNSVLTGN